jgi:hypothetical protein
MMTDFDSVDVAAENGVIPNAGMIAQRDVAENHSAARDVNAGAKPWRAAQECVELTP